MRLPKTQKQGVEAKTVIYHVYAGSEENLDRLAIFNLIYLLDINGGHLTKKKKFKQLHPPSHIHRYI